MYYTHAQKTNKQTNTTLSLTLSLPRPRSGPAPLWTISFSSLSPEGNDCCPSPIFSCISREMARLFRRCGPPTREFTTPPQPTAYPSWDARTLWPPHRWSFERVSSWWWGRFRPWRCSSLRGSSQNSCPCPPALGAGWPSFRWRGPRGRSSSPSPRRAARRPLDHVRYSEH